MSQAGKLPFQGCGTCYIHSRLTTFRVLLWQGTLCKGLTMWNPSMKPCAGSSMGGMSGRGGNPLLSILTPGSEGGLSSGSMSAEPVVDGGTRVCRLPGSPMRVPVLAPRSSNTSGGQ